MLSLHVVMVVLLADPVQIELGGPRQIRGSVEKGSETYVIRVDFRPVRVFDSATNEEVNSELAREFALRTLARHLSSSTEVAFTSGGEEVIRMGLRGDRYSAVIRWPLNGVQLLSNPTTREELGRKGTRLVRPAAFQNGFFTARQDHLDTLVGLLAVHQAAIKRTAAEVNAAPAAEQRKALARSISEIEERSLGALETLENRVRTDERLLDTTERPEILRAIESNRAKVIQTLTDTLAKVPPADDSPFSDVQITAPYGEYLEGHPLLMELAGAAMIETESGGYVLLGIGKVVLKDGGPLDLLRAEKVGVLKAKTAAIGERDGADFRYLKQVKDRIVLIKDSDGKERVDSISERVKIIRERIAGTAKGLSVVGRWRSKAGKSFYIAVGGRFDAKGEPIR